MSRVVADPAVELSGTAVRRLTRRAAAARAQTTLLTRLGDAVGTVTSVAVVIAVLGGSLASFRDKITTGRLPETGTTLPGPLAAVAAGVVALAGVVLLLDRLGPVSSTPAAAAWWLPLPADRRGLLRGELLRIAEAVVAAAVLLALPVVLGLPRSPTAASAGIGLGWVAAAAAAAVGGTALLQTWRLGGRLGAAAGALAVLAAAMTAGAGTVAAAEGRRVATPALPGAPGWGAGALAVLAGALLVAAAVGLGRLGATQLRETGATAQFAAGSVLSLDTRDLGRALAGRQRTPRRSRRFRRVRRPWQALAAGDLAVLARGPWQLGQLALAVALPVLVARTAGLGSVPLVVWGGCLAGWWVAAIAAGRPARAAQAAPVLDRLLPLSARDTLLARGAVPLALTVLVCALTGALIGAGSGAVAGWAALGAAAAPAWAAAALRAAYRPELDWSGQVLATPIGPLPPGVIGTLLQGIDAGVLGSLPLAAALVAGRPTAGLVIGQLAWSCCVATAAGAWLLHRRDRAR